MAPIPTARLVLREAVERDRGALIEMLCDPRAQAHLGGPKPRDEVAASLPAVLRGDQPQSVRDAALPFPQAKCIIADRATDQFMGYVFLTRRSPELPVHLGPEGNKLELAYSLLPAFWGHGYAEEACRALLETTALHHRQDEPVLVLTQSSNARSIALVRRLGFVEREQFEQWGAMQTLAVVELGAFRATTSADSR